MSIEMTSEVAASAFVQKQDDLEYDLGYLCASDLHAVPLDACKSSAAREELLLKTSTENAQLLFDKLFKLEKHSGKTIAVLPPTKTALPRQKPAPQPKPETRWDKYAKEKGIENKKRDRMVWDEDSQSWKPRWGYKSVTDTDKKDWVIEVNDNDDMSQDPFERRREEKKLRVMKNKQQQVYNKLRANPEPEPALPAGLNANLGPSKKIGKGKKGTLNAIKSVQVSTASLGRFDEKVAGEPKKKIGERKRKFQPAEKVDDVARDMKILDRILGKGASRSSHSHGLDLVEKTNQVGKDKRKKGRR